MEATTGSSALDGCLGLDLRIELGLVNDFDGLGVDYEGLQSDFFRDDLVCGLDGYELTYTGTSEGFMQIDLVWDDDGGMISK